MDVALALVVPGLVGGFVLALLLARLNSRTSPDPVRRSSLEPVSPDLINMAHIRVAGVGGLGMMAAGVVIAIYVPEIGISLLTGFVLGTIGAIALIAWRSRAAATGRGGHDGSLPSIVAREDAPQITNDPGRDVPGRRFVATA